VGFTVSTLVVVPGTGVCTGTTEPFCDVLPERGSGLTGVLCEEEGVPPNWARAQLASTRIAAVDTTKDLLT
jgi:hypothetical protein